MLTIMLEFALDQRELDAGDAETFGDGELLDVVAIELGRPEPIEKFERVLDHWQMLVARRHQAGIEHHRGGAIEAIVPDMRQIGVEWAEERVWLGAHETVHRCASGQRPLHRRGEPRPDEAVGVEHYAGLPMQAQRFDEHRRLGAKNEVAVAHPAHRRQTIGDVDDARAPAGEILRPVGEDRDARGVAADLGEQRLDAVGEFALHARRFAEAEIDELRRARARSPIGLRPSSL